MSKKKILLIAVALVIVVVGIIAAVISQKSLSEISIGVHNLPFYSIFMNAQ